MEGQQGWKDINISKESKKDITDGRTSMVEVHKYPEGKKKQNMEGHQGWKDINIPKGSKKDVKGWKDNND